MSTQPPTNEERDRLRQTALAVLDTHSENEHWAVRAARSLSVGIKRLLEALEAAEARAAAAEVEAARLRVLVERGIGIMEQARAELKQDDDLIASQIWVLVNDFREVALGWLKKARLAMKRAALAGGGAQEGAEE